MERTTTDSPDRNVGGRRLGAGGRTMRQCLAGRITSTLAAVRISSTLAQDDRRTRVVTRRSLCFLVVCGESGWQTCKEIDGAGAALFGFGLSGEEGCDPREPERTKSPRRSTTTGRERRGGRLCTGARPCRVASSPIPSATRLVGRACLGWPAPDARPGRHCALASPRLSCKRWRGEHGASCSSRAGAHHHAVLAREAMARMSTVLHA